jgi:serine/threonine protein kinase
MSPELFESLFKKKDQKIDQSKSDVFSLGLIIIQLALNREIEDLFETKNGYLNKNRLNEFYEEFRSRYLESKFLITLVNKMIEFDPMLRPSIRQLFQSLPKWKEVE